MKKNQILAIILLMLVAINIFLLLFDNGNDSNSWDRELFIVADTSQIGTVALRGTRDSSVFAKVDGKWLLNGRHKVDQNLKNVMLRVLNSVKIQRPVSKIEGERLFQESKEKGVEVIVKSLKGVVLQHFYAHGNPLHTQSYFADESSKKTFVMEIPGYTNYISGLFSLAPSQWRDRLLFATSWSSLLEISVDYIKNEDDSFSIIPGENFPTLQEVTVYDTTFLQDYLERFSYFQSNEIIPAGMFPRYDSLAQTLADAVITVRDLDNSTSNSVYVYPPLPGESIQLTIDSHKNMAVIETKRLKRLLVKKVDFQ